MLAAIDAEDRASQLLTLTERLTALLTQETAAFERRRPHEAIPTLEETGRLANLYRHEAARVRANPALLADASPEQRLRLVRATQAFDATCRRHERAVLAAKTVTEGVVKAIADEVAAARAPAQGYGPGATSVAAAAAASAITLNRRA
jgi:hypothetical protein